MLTIPYFIPDKLTIGTFDFANRRLSSNAFELAAMSFKFDEAWENLGVFSRLVGYPPHKQRDSEKELTKVLENRINTIENVPTRGFSIVTPISRIYNPYLLSSNKLGAYYNVLLKDPRGFIFPISDTNFYTLLNYVDCTIDSGNIPGDFVYMWERNSGVPTLVSTKSSLYAKALAESESHIGKVTTKTVDKTIVKNRIYHATKVIGTGDYLYIGRMPTYSAECHIDALAKGKYDCAAFIAKEAPIARLKYVPDADYPTTADRHIFIRIHDPKTSSARLDLVDVITKRSCNSLFMTDVTDSYDRGVIDTLVETARKIVESSLLFNKVDLTTVQMVNMPKSTLSKLLMSNYDYDMHESMYPYARSRYVRGNNSLMYFANLDSSLTYEVFPSKYRWGKLMVTDKCDWTVQGRKVNDLTEYPTFSYVPSAPTSSIQSSYSDKTTDELPDVLPFQQVTAKTEAGNALSIAHQIALTGFYFESRRRLRRASAQPSLNV